jgi:hypothetical protein
VNGEAAAIPADYADWLTNIKTRAVMARQRAVLAANAELIQLTGTSGETSCSRRQSRAGAGRSSSGWRETRAKHSRR